MIERHGVTNLYTAPTALRAIRKEDPDLELPANHDIRSLRGIFLAGERADPGTIDAYHAALGVDMVDNWWQTERYWPFGFAHGCVASTHLVFFVQPCFS